MIELVDDLIHDYSLILGPQRWDFKVMYLCYAAFLLSSYSSREDDEGDRLNKTGWMRRWDGIGYRMASWPCTAGTGDS